MVDTTMTAIAECQTVVDSIKAKADKYKRMTKWSTLSLTALTVAIPVVIGTIEPAFWAKIVPSGLAALAAFAAAFIQIEKPQERWSLYRRYQRLGEAEVLRFRFKSDPYAADHSDELLVKRMAQLQLDLHDEWAGLVPRSADFLAAPTSGAEGK